MPEPTYEFDLHAEVRPGDMGVGAFGHRRIAEWVPQPGKGRAPRSAGQMPDAAK